MPQRSTAFQDLIALLERQLAPVGAVVTESALVPETLTGNLREVDILIRGPFGAREVVVGIECRDHQRKGDIHWIEQARSKFDVLPIDKRVLVARSGFTKAAIVRARQWNIEVISLAQAVTVDWAVALTKPRDWSIMRVRCRIIGVRLACATPEGIAGLSPAEPLRFAHHGIVESAADFGQRLTLLESVQKDLFSKVEQIHEWTKLTIKFRFSSGACHTPDELGVHWPVKWAEFDILCKGVRKPTSPQFAIYSKAVVGTSAGVVDEAPFTVAMSQAEGKAPQGIARVINSGQILEIDLSEFF